METGLMISMDGVEGAGRTSHANQLAKKLEYQGYGVINLDIQKSKLFGNVINKKKKDIFFETRTLFMAHATALADLGNIIKSSMESGFIVIFDGYIDTLKSWGLVRGLDEAWMNTIFSMLIKPDIEVHLYAASDIIITRIIKKMGFLDPLTSSIELCNFDLYDSYINYISNFQDELIRPSRHIINVDTSGKFNKTSSKIVKRIYNRINRNKPAELK
jgi:dTMP kinase